jgi:hypothetical protein
VAGLPLQLRPGAASVGHQQPAADVGLREVVAGQPAVLQQQPHPVLSTTTSSPSSPRIRRGDGSRYSSPSPDSRRLNAPAGAFPNGPCPVIIAMAPP